MHQTSPTVRAAFAGAVAVSLGLLGAAAGCSGPVTAGPEAHARAYPFEADRAQVHDIQVFREGTHLRLTNTTAKSFGPGTLWVNQRFSLPVDGLAVGQSLDLNLYDFVDEFGEKFRAGGFFATRNPDPVVLVQYETAADDAMHGLVLVRDDVD
jgi:hypothetical protein